MIVMVERGAEWLVLGVVLVLWVVQKEKKVVSNKKRRRSPLLMGVLEVIAFVASQLTHLPVWWS